MRKKADRICYMLHEESTGSIIKMFYSVYNELGFAFLKKVYQNAMLIVLKNERFKVEVQKKIEVRFGGETVRKYYADIVINN